jgi:hypothetical protein
MRKEKIARMYSEMSSQEQRQYGRWLAANVAISSLFAAGFLAIALMGGSGWKYEAAIQPSVSTARNSLPNVKASDPILTGSIGPAKARAAGQPH